MLVCSVNKESQDREVGGGQDNLFITTSTVEILSLTVILLTAADTAITLSA